MSTISILRQLSFLFLLFILTISNVTAQFEPLRLLNYSCTNDNNYTSNSIYSTNLQSLLSNLTSNKDIDYGFYNLSVGENPKKVNAVGMCRGDIKPDDCRTCLYNATIVLPQRCPTQKEAIAWLETCMLRYSNRSIFGLMETDPSFAWAYEYDATDVAQFNQVLSNLMERLRISAASGDSRRKFAADNVPGPGYQTIYAIVQCTPDLSQQKCSDCLLDAVARVPECCRGKGGGRVVGPSCNFRYEMYRFYDPSVDPPSTSGKGSSISYLSFGLLNVR
ncbi:hypothetical protein L6164_016935 [Bauhinia variegata]|uniref:Uncharacterized protein n=1 Tax=Bauhinia variegata TaxID=167791 RepID=A0ACB9N633_BAUVA|nr:hypothetical protein L6164_016935 [Bauhinia variegata]